MGQKTHPTGLRIGINKTHGSTWFANYGAYSEVLKEDYKLRTFFEKEFETVYSKAGITKLEILRKVNQLELDTDPTHLESRLTKLETRIEDNDIGRISSQIEQVRGTIKVLEGKVEGLDIPDTSEVETNVKVLETEVKELKEKVHKITNKKSNPLL